MRRLSILIVVSWLSALAAAACTGQVRSDTSTDGGNSGVEGDAPGISGDADGRTSSVPDSSVVDTSRGGDGMQDDPDYEPSDKFRKRIRNAPPTYQRRDFVPGIGVRITYDISSYKVLSGRHVQVRVRSRRFFDNPHLEIAGERVQPEFLRSAGMTGGFEWIWKIPAVPAGQHRVDFYGSRGDRTPTATAPLFVYPYDERDGYLTNASFEQGDSTPPTGWKRWQDVSGSHSGIALGYRSTGAGDREVVHRTTSVTMTSSYKTHRAGLLQTVDVGGDKVGCHAKFSVSAIAWSIEKDDQSTSDYCGSGSFRVLAGLDPSGGADPQAGSVAWSDNWDPCPEFSRLEVTEKIDSPSVTVFLKSAPKWPLKQATSIWDHARLEIECN